MKPFMTLEALNEFLAEKGLPLLTEKAIQEAMNNQIGEGATEDVIKLSLVHEDDNEVDPGFAAAFEAAFGVAPVQEKTSDDEHDAAVAFSLDQIAMLIKQRDQARDLFNAECKAHDACHAAFNEELKDVHLSGVVEGMAADLFPDTPFEKLEKNMKQALLQQAKQHVDRIEAIRRNS